jgi:4a-hydroxytetrahydrobiopterin dehydratase
VSEQGWRQFIAAEGIDDWVVLHGGPTAVFPVASLTEGAELAAAIAAVPGLGERTAITLTKHRLTVRLTREMWGVEPSDIAVVKAISEVARARGTHGDRSATQEVQFAVSAKPDELDIGFWHAVLGYDPLHGDNGIDPLAHGSTFWMQDLDPGKPLRHAMHIDVSLAPEEARKRVDAGLAAGGRLVQESNAPGSWILADKAGNKVCIAAWPDGAPTPDWQNEG